MSRLFILHDINVTNVLTNWYRNNCPINKQVKLFFFMLHEFADFSEYI